MLSGQIAAKQRTAEESKYMISYFSPAEYIFYSKHPSATVFHLSSIYTAVIEPGDTGNNAAENLRQPSTI